MRVWHGHSNNPVDRGVVSTQLLWEQFVRNRPNAAELAENELTTLVDDVPGPYAS
jgi:hypothetical protein